MSPPATKGTTPTGITGDHGPTYWPPAGGTPGQSRGAAGAERSELALDGTGGLWHPVCEHRPKRGRPPSTNVGRACAPSDKGHAVPASMALETSTVRPAKRTRYGPPAVPARASKRSALVMGAAAEAHVRCAVAIASIVRLSRATACQRAGAVTSRRSIPTRPRRGLPACLTPDDSVLSPRRDTPPRFPRSGRA
jgi:hypothetical protein